MKRLILLVCVGTIVIGGALGVRHWRWKRHFNTRIAEHTLADGSGGTFAPVEDWPRWRGPRGDGISRETDLAESWPADGPRRLWSAEVGLGYSSPVAAGGVVYLFTLNSTRETLTAFDARTGHILWSDEAATGWTGDYAGTRSTPTIDGDAIYTFGGAGDLLCRDRATGKPRWQINVLKLTESKNLNYGAASSPLVVGDAVYVQGGAGGAIAVALNKHTGATIWQSETHGIGGYAQPVLADVAGTQQLIVFCGQAVVGMDPATGKTRWSQPWATSYQVNSTTPVYAEPNLFITSSYAMGGMMLRVSPDGAEKLWANKLIRSKFQQVIHDGDCLFGNSEGILTCLSWPDGKLNWKSDRSEVWIGANGSIVRVGDKLLVMGEDGELILLRATSSGVTRLARLQVIEGPEVWATPLLYAGRLYVKGLKEFVCFDVSNAAGRKAPATLPVARAK